MAEAPASRFAAIADRVWHELVSAGFEGSDPYDGLNSRLLAPVLKHSRFARLAVIQGVKRSPVDLRPLLRISPGLICLASRTDGSPALASRSITPGAAARVADGTASWPSAVGWGYDFPWQAKAFLQPAFHPTVVATSFVLDALKAVRSPALPAVARSAGYFVADNLHRHEDADGVCFSYSPGDRTRVYNASLFGARILVQAATYNPAESEAWRDLSRRAVEWVLARQAADGSWIYGEADHWRWIDNLHTGFNLETIGRLARLHDTAAWDDALRLGLSFYRDRLFEADGTPRYYTYRRWPLDPHSFAQGALTFLALARLDESGPEFADRILLRGIEELWDDRRGGFRFQKQRLYSQGVIHMRWSQAWMFRALRARVAAT